MSCGLHDVLAFEGLGRPSVLVCSDVFVQAAIDQAALLGAPGLRRLFVSHPIQNRTDAEMTALGEAVAGDLAEALTRRPEPAAG